MAQPVHCKTSSAGSAYPVCASLARLALVALLIAPAFAQSNAPGAIGATPPQPASQDQTNEQPSETLKVQVNVVNLFFNVKDKRGALIPGLHKEDFTVLEDGKPQTIKYFSANTDLPLTLGILIDTSISQERVLSMEKDVGAAFLKDVLREKDLAFVINFDVDVNLDQDFTSSNRELRAALDAVKINGGGANVSTGIPGVGQGPIPAGSNPRGTLLYDAIYLAADEKLKSEVGRKAMIILTDGEDQGSKEKIQDAIEQAQKADAICYVLLIADRGFYGGGYSGERYMKQLTEQTGGSVINVGNDERKLKEGFDQIANELRTQYSVGYSSTNAKHDGTFRKVEIETKAGKVKARKGYYAPQG